MTVEEFNNTKFGARMQVIYRGEAREIVSVDFEEKLIGLNDKFYDPEDPDDIAQINWVRCENCKLV